MKLLIIITLVLILIFTIVSFSKDWVNSDKIPEEDISKERKSLCIKFIAFLSIMVVLGVIIVSKF